MTLEIPADVTGAALVVTRQHHLALRLAIVEVKVRPINLRDLSQAIGYAKVAQPDYAFLVSPNGWAEKPSTAREGLSADGCVGICPEAMACRCPMGHDKPIGKSRRHVDTC